VEGAAAPSRKHSQIAPDVPTVAEAGLKALEVEVLYIMMVPAATPEPLLAVLHQALTEALQQPDVKARP
jgi:tripartite-type tricarboxylate transporter receptor subunit TctC